MRELDPRCATINTASSTPARVANADSKAMPWPARLHKPRGIPEEHLRTVLADEPNTHLRQNWGQHELPNSISPDLKQRLKKQYRAIPEEFYATFCPTMEVVCHPENLLDLATAQAKHGERWNIWELCSGSATLSTHGLLHDYAVGWPIDYRYGFDIADPRVARTLEQTLDTVDVDVMFVSPNCRLWGQSTAQMDPEKREQQREQELPALHTIRNSLEKQMKKGHDWAMEQPKDSELFFDVGNPIGSFIDEVRDSLHFTELDQCEFDAVDADDNLIRKRTLMVSTFPLPHCSRMCTGTHTHVWCQSRCKGAPGPRTTMAAKYPVALCYAILRDVWDRVCSLGREIGISGCGQPMRPYVDESWPRQRPVAANTEPQEPQHPEPPKPHPEQCNPYQPWCGTCQSAAMRRKQHRRLDSAPEGTLAVDLSGPHTPTPLPDRPVSPDHCARYYLVAMYYPPGETIQPPNVVDNSRFDDVTDLDDNAPDLIADVSAVFPGKFLMYTRLQVGKSAEETLISIQSVIAQIHGEARGKVIRLHSDRGGEFIGTIVRQWVASCHIWQTFTEGDDPRANGAAEQGVNLSKNMARAALLQAKLSTQWWGMAILEASAAQRRRALGQHPPHVPFGARVYVCRRPDVGDAFSPKASLGTTLGTAIHTPRAFYVYRDGRIETTGSLQPAGIINEEIHWAKMTLEQIEEEPVALVAPQEEDVRALPPLHSPKHAMPACPACRGQKRRHTRIWSECNIAVPPVDPHSLLPGPRLDEVVPRLDEVVPPSDPYSPRFDEVDDAECQAADHNSEEQGVQVQAAVGSGIKPRTVDTNRHDDELDPSDSVGNKDRAQIVNDLKESGLQPVKVGEIRKTYGQEKEEWKQAVEHELHSFDDRSAMRDASEEEKAEILSKKGDWQLLPALVIAGMKPPDKAGNRAKKIRIAACGNFQDKNADGSFRIDTQQADATSIRLLLRIGALMKWSIGSIDVRTAYLYAPLPETMRVAIRPPQLLVDWGYVKPGTIWVLLVALYGLRVAGRLWQATRDGELVGFKWTHEGEPREVRRVKLDPSLWRIVNPTIEYELKGLLAIVVDDFLATAPIGEIRAFFENAVQATWKTAAPSYVEFGSGLSLRFCGIRAVDLKGAGYGIHQNEFIVDLLYQYGLTKARGSPTPGDKEQGTLTSYAQQKKQTNENRKTLEKLTPQQRQEFEDLDCEAKAAVSRILLAAAQDAPVRPEDVKAAQGVAGSLQWLACRTRPDIAFTACCVSTLSTLDPISALAIGQRCLRYLIDTQDLMLVYSARNLTDEEKRFLVNADDTNNYSGFQGYSRPTSSSPDGFSNPSVFEMATWTDASWAPSGGTRSHLGDAVFWAEGLIAWRTCKASLTALSSCEAEVQAGSMGYLLGASIQQVLFALHMGVQHVMWIENTAAITILDGTETWRTRHLASVREPSEIW